MILGSFLAILASFFHEVAASIGKKEIKRKEESIYALGFFTHFWGALFFALFGFIITKNIVFVAASLPLFAIRFLLEIVQAEAGIRALAKADRSTYTFLRTGTIPLLLVADVLLGYTFSLNQIM